MRKAHNNASFAVMPKQLEQMKEAAKTKGLSLSGFIRYLFEEYQKGAE